MSAGEDERGRDGTEAKGAAPIAKVLSIVGPGRSGSTLIGNILGEVPGFFCPGELRYVWQRGLIEGRRCGCGERITTCSVWGEALVAALSSGGGATAAQLDASTVVSWLDELSRYRARPRVLDAGAQEGWAALDSYVALLGALYRSLLGVTGARVIVDTSKRVHDAALTAVLPVEHYVLHLVRDPRAVAYSWGRPKKRLDGSEGVMRGKGIVKSALKWDESSLWAARLRQLTPPSRWMELRYEDFTLRPEAAVRHVLSMVGEAESTIPFHDARTVRLSVNHTVSGNPDRFRTGLVPIREDTEWHDRVGRRAWLTVTALTFPFLRRHGYPWARGASTRTVPPLGSRSRRDAPSESEQAAQ